MQYIFLTITILFFISALTFNVFAQTEGLEPGLTETLEVPAEPEVAAPEAPSDQTQTPTQPLPGVSTSQRTSRSNMSCIKVGAADDAAKPAICSEQAQTEGGGFIGPIGGGDIKLEYCGETPEGEVIMCYKPGYVFYCQGDPQWGNACSLASAGCGPTTMAMILSAYGDTATPLQTDQIFQKRGWRSCGDNPSYMQTAIQKLLPEIGYEYQQLGVPLNLSRAQEYLNAGYLIIGSTFGHIFVIDGVNVSNNTLSLRDPGRCENKNGVIRSASAPWNGQSLMYAYAVKKRPTSK